MKKEYINSVLYQMNLHLDNQQLMEFKKVLENAIEKGMPIEQVQRLLLGI